MLALVLVGELPTREPDCLLLSSRGVDRSAAPEASSCQLPARRLRSRLLALEANASRAKHCRPRGSCCAHGSARLRRESAASRADRARVAAAA